MLVLVLLVSQLRTASARWTGGPAAGQRGGGAAGRGGGVARCPLRKTEDQEHTFAASRSTVQADSR